MKKSELEELVKTLQSDKQKLNDHITELQSNIEEMKQRKNELMQLMSQQNARIAELQDTKQPPTVTSVEKLLFDENMNLKKQLKQLETKKESVSRIKYDELKSQCQKTTTKFAAVESLEKKDNISGSDVVSKAEFEKMREHKNQWAKLYELQNMNLNYSRERIISMESEIEKLNDKKTSNQDVEPKENNRVYRNEIDTLNNRIKELEEKLSRQGTGRPRENMTTDEEIIQLKSDGKSYREINKLTGVSTARIYSILKAK